MVLWDRQALRRLAPSEGGAGGFREGLHMSLDRTEGRRRTRRRAYRPTLDGGLESRFLLSNLPGSVFLRHPKPGVAFEHNQPKFRNGTTAHPFPIARFPRGPHAAVQVAHAGQSAIVV